MNCKKCHYYIKSKTRKGFGHCHAEPPKGIYIGELIDTDGKVKAPRFIITVGETWETKMACWLFKPIFKKSKKV